MINLNHWINFLNNSNNWVPPQNFDSLFQVLLTIYFIITFVPDFVKYFRVNNLIRSAKIRKFSYNMLEELITSLEKESIGKKNLFLSAYTTFLNGMDIGFVEIEEKLFRVWKRYIKLHLVVIITSFLYLFFGAYCQDSILVNRNIVSLSIFLLLLPFIFSLISAFNAIRTNVNTVKEYAIKIQEISKAYQVGKTEEVLKQIEKFSR